jgi:hypothetical protein
MPTQSEMGPPTSSDLPAHVADERTLGCTDAASSTPGNGENDVTLHGASLSDVRGSNTPLPAVSAMRLRVSGAPGYFQKAPLNVLAGAAPVTLEVVEPATMVLGWAPASKWTGGTPPDLTDHLARRITFTGCPGRDVTYFGGLLLADPGACVTLRWTSTGHRAVPVTAALGGVRCKQTAQPTS